MRRSPSLAAAAVCLATAISSTVWAQATWFGASAGGDGQTWQDAGNWDTGVVPELPGDLAIFDANLGVPFDAIQLAGDVTLERLEIINSGVGPWVLGDNDPDNPLFDFIFDGGFPSTWLVGATGGGHRVERSVNRILLNSDLQIEVVDPSDALVIDTSFDGFGSGLQIVGNGGVEFTGNDFFVDVVENDAPQTVIGQANTQSLIQFDFITAPAGTTHVDGFMNVIGATVADGAVVVRGGANIRGGALGGGGMLDLQPGSTLVATGANVFAGVAQLEGTLSVGGPHGGNAVIFPGGGVGSTSPAYDPLVDPAIVVDPSVIAPGSVNLSIDVLGYGAAINPNFNNGVANAYRVGSATAGSIVGPIAPFDDLLGTPVYFFGGNEGNLDVNANLADSLFSGNATDVNVDAGRIRFNTFNFFSGQATAEGGQLILSHPNAVGLAASLTATSPAALAGLLQFDGGNFDHGTVVLDPALVGGYVGPALSLDGGALGFTLPTNVDFGLSLAGGQTGPALFDIGDFDRGGVATNASLLGLGGDARITLNGTAGFVDDARSPSGNPVVLFTSGNARVTLQQPNAHTGGTAVLEQSTLVVQDVNALGGGPVNIADGATLSFETSGAVANNLDLHSTAYGAASGIDVAAGQNVHLAGNISTAHAPGATFRKTGDGDLIIDPAAPILPFNDENLWGLRLVAGTTLLGQLPELEAAVAGVSQGPLIVEEFSAPRLDIFPHANGNATDPNLAGFGRLSVERGSIAEFFVDDQFFIGGLQQGHVLAGHLIKLGGAPLVLGGDTSGGDAIGFTPFGRGLLDIRSGDVIIGDVPFTDNGANAFPTGARVNVEDGANLIVARLDTPATIHTLTVNPLTFGAGATANLSNDGIAPLIVERLVQDDGLRIGGNGAVHYAPVAPPVFSAASFQTITIDPNAALVVDGSRLPAGEALVDPNSGQAAHIVNDSAAGLHIVAGHVKINGLNGMNGRTTIDAGASLTVAGGPVTQSIFTINGTLNTLAVTFAVDRIEGNGTGDGFFGLTTVAPGDGGIGTLQFLNSANASTGTIYEFELGGTNQGVDYDLLRLDLASSIEVHGAFDVRLVGGFTPSLGDVFTVIDAPAGIDAAAAFPFPGSEFEKETALVLGGGNVLRAKLNPTDVDLVTTFAADFDVDFDVDSGDLNVWQSVFGTTGFGPNGKADADGDGDSDGADFLTWQLQQGSQHPATPIASGIPEPMTAMHAIGLLLFAALRPVRIRDDLLVYAA